MEIDKENHEVADMNMESLYKYLPFIDEMLLKTSGTAIEGKWKMMASLFRNPQRR